MAVPNNRQEVTTTSSRAPSEGRKSTPAEDKELYLECLGHLMGLRFKPKSNLELEVDVEVEDTYSQSKYFKPTSTKSPLKNNNFCSQVASSKNDTVENFVTFTDLSLKKSKTWKPGAVTKTLSKFGIRMTSNAKTQPSNWKSLILKPESRKKGDIQEKPATNDLQRKDVGVGTDILGSDGFHFIPPSAQSTTKTLGLSKPCKTSFKVPMKRPGSAGQTLNQCDAKIGEHSSSDTIFGKRPKLQVEGNTNVTNNPRGSAFSVVRKDIIQAGSNGDGEKGNESTTIVKAPGFQTALTTLLENDKKNGIKRKLDRTPPNDSNTLNNNKNSAALTGESDASTSNNPELDELLAHEKMKVFEPKIVEAILSEVMEEQLHTEWDDIAGLNGPKAVIKEIIIWPMLRPDIFTGLRASPKGILLFGPPGTGKTMIGRLIATQSSSTFFNISASSLTSKWIGDGEKMVRCLFEVARIKQPSVIFIDEIDSILTQRSETEHESSRRLKTEFLIQFDGCGTKNDDRVLVIGVTNRPQELDEAARRRLAKRIYIPLPDFQGRKQIVQNLIRDQNCKINEDDINKVAEITEGYSGADMRGVCQEASYGPIRDIGHMLENIAAENVRSIDLNDFFFAVKRVKSSVALKDLEVYEEWDKDFGCHIDQ